ncbi:MAG: hypothetical protein DRJ96_09865 [Thermoprotei archaeon]|nr:hypothetical protein [Thermoproteales archaeon]RLE85483.1 MAG: hypothetical protein DRJ67_08790 [Thermoprotei archaeon]RLE93747.1 MAG: hypothetical protein DRJ96_09865 [Thermoprotei archaeon]RLE96411.1 MAG: hypothetical protein DRJ57_05525 [Thermoprotei archaeon]
MSITPVERFVLAHILYSYGGKMYFTTPSGQAPEEALASFLAEDFVDPTDRRYERIRKAFAEALRGLKEKWLIELRGYEVLLTVVGRQEAEKISRELYNELKRKFSS